MALSRRDFLARSGTVGLGIALTGSVESLLAAGPALAGSGSPNGYGPLVPDPAGLLDLPQGFKYKVLSKTGTPMKSGGGLVPDIFDGMASFAGPHDSTFLVRNHEQEEGEAYPVLAAPSHTFDEGQFGGTTTLQISHDGKVLQEYVSLAGTRDNCAGGRTPWNTWISCEENEQVVDGVAHGWCFEVDPYDNSKNANPVPLTAMGRFQHEAIAVDPRTGVVYETEDFRNPLGLLYRFLPNQPLGGYGSLRAGGTLQAMKAAGLTDLSVVQTVGATFPISWVTVPDPLATTVKVRSQFSDSQVTRSEKLEGIWWGDECCYFVASFATFARNSAAEHSGQVWKLDPVAQTITLVLIFAGGGEFDSPDNITVSPWGGVILCEDGSGDGNQYIVGTTSEDKPYAFARNAGVINDEGYSEFAGATFSRDGKTLFVNAQKPGHLFAITGPWKRQNHKK